MINKSLLIVQVKYLSLVMQGVSIPYEIEKMDTVVYHKRFLAKARPECDFRYVSNSNA